MDRFMKDMESVIGHQGSEDASSNLDIEEGSSSDSDMDFGNFFLSYQLDLTQQNS